MNKKRDDKRQKFALKLFDRLYGSSPCSDEETAEDDLSEHSTIDDHTLSESRSDGRPTNTVTPPLPKVVSSPDLISHKYFRVGNVILKNKETEILSSGDGSASDDSDGSKIKPKRRKRGRHHASIKTIKDTEVSSASFSLSHQKDSNQILTNQAEQNKPPLTKNQKRKLKKKKRDKVRQLEQVKDTSTHFCLKSASDESHASTSDANIAHQVSEFLDAVWDLYSIENATTSIDSGNTSVCDPQSFKDLMSRLHEDAYKEELNRLHSLRCTVMLNNQQKSLEVLQEYLKGSSFHEDVSSFIDKLFRYWICDVLSTK